MSILRLLASIVLAVFLSQFLLGCTNDTGQIDAVRTTQALKDAGFKGKAVFIFGNAHFLGQSFNLTGSSGYCEVIIDPSQSGPIVHPALNEVEPLPVPTIGAVK